ncbi:DUF4007 family protein [Oleispirillum naphthae]|uniref:DUF4007 family protein n=1 Tax=Oleispirillum naphthae TaxID=2838853 RepID=UPI003082620E
MVRGPLYRDEYRPAFSGHETFPLRYGWLKKAYDAVAAGQSLPDSRQIFRSDEAIARFGVGKNMVASIRHWANCCGIIAEDSAAGQLTTTEIGDFLFGENGVDPYLESTASLWHIHWLLCCGDPVRPIKTTWFWVFNHFTSVNFKRDDLVEGLMRLSESRGWKRVARTTVQRDVECFVRMYETRPSGLHGPIEESLESPLAELGLVRGHKGHFHLARGSKATLPDGVFAVALNDFWNRQGSTRTLSFEMVAYEPGSPGRVFLLDEPDLADHLFGLEDATKGNFRWSETAGLKQMLRDHPLDPTEAQDLLRGDYKARHGRKAA